MRKKGMKKGGREGNKRKKNREEKKNENHVGNVVCGQNQSSCTYICDASSSKCHDT